MEMGARPLSLPAVCPGCRHATSVPRQCAPRSPSPARQSAGIRAVMIAYRAGLTPVRCNVYTVAARCLTERGPEGEDPPKETPLTLSVEFPSVCYPEGPAAVGRLASAIERVAPTPATRRARRLTRTKTPSSAASSPCGTMGSARVGARTLAAIFQAVASAPSTPSSTPWHVCTRKIRARYRLTRAAGGREWPDGTAHALARHPIRFRGAEWRRRSRSKPCDVAGTAPGGDLRVIWCRIRTDGGVGYADPFLRGPPRTRRCPPRSKRRKSRASGDERSPGLRRAPRPHRLPASPPAARSPGHEPKRTPARAVPRRSSVDVERFMEGRP